MCFQEAGSVLHEDKVVVVVSDPAKTTAKEATEDNKDKIVNFVVSEAGKEKIEAGEENIETSASAATYKEAADEKTAPIENKTPVNKKDTEHINKDDISPILIDKDDTTPIDAM